jgi:hypothetical protein
MSNANAGEMAMREKIEAELAKHKAALARVEAMPLPKLKAEKARLGATEFAYKHAIGLLEELLK